MVLPPDVEKEYVTEALLLSVMAKSISQYEPAAKV
jgi:hypothetical protein